MMARQSSLLTARALPALGATALTSVFAPAVFMWLLWTAIAVANPSAGLGLPELVGMTAWGVMLGWLPSILSCVVALPAIWLASRLKIVSPLAYAIGGAVLAIASWAVMSASKVVEWSFGGVAVELITSLAITGAAFGAFWWIAVARASVNYRANGDAS